MGVYCGVDVGAVQTKVTLVGEDESVLSFATVRSGINFSEAAESALQRVMRGTGLHRREITRTVACGYGRHNVGFADGVRTEISCHARAAFHHFGRTLILVDIGGQDNKVIRVDAEGKVSSFKMNRKCAAGTGAFLEEIAIRIDVPLQRMNHIAKEADGEVELGSFCTVFTATEMLSHIRKGVPVAHLVRGAFRSVVKRIVEMDRLDGFVVLSGGVVAHNPVLVSILSDTIGSEAAVVPEPETAGAFGAALFAKEEVNE